MKPRFSIARLLAFVVVCGVGFAALHSPSYLWANILFTMSLAALVIATIDLVYSRGRSRAFAAGFLIAGGTYFTISTVPPLREAMCVRLVTEPVLDMLYSFTAPAPRPVPPIRPAMMQGMMMGGGSPSMMGMMGGAPFPASPVEPTSRWEVWTEPDRSNGVGYVIGTVFLVSSEAYRDIGHSLATLLIAFLGGLYARRRFNLSSQEAGDPARA